MDISKEELQNLIVKSFTDRLFDGLVRHLSQFKTECKDDLDNYPIRYGIKRSAGKTLYYKARYDAACEMLDCASQTYNRSF